jgi:hypothetical protein
MVLAPKANANVMLASLVQDATRRVPAALNVRVNARKGFVCVRRIVEELHAIF